VNYSRWIKPNEKEVIHMAVKLNMGSSIPNSAQWVAIVVFAIGAVALIPKYITLTSVTTGYLLLVGALLALALKVFTTIPEPVAEPKKK
jgi:hypothetical protein